MAKRKRSVAARRKAAAPPQLFPVNAVWCAPKRLGGIDSTQTCMCDDGHEYVVKLDVPDRFAAHNDWFCSSLARRVGLPGPAFNPVRHTDGRVWFGSQWIAGEIPDWWLHVSSGGIPFAVLADDWARIYAFDLFINNTDRHLRNFMVINTGGTYTLHALDYGRAWLHNGMPIPALPLPPLCKTVLSHRVIRATLNTLFSIPAATQVLDAIGRFNFKKLEEYCMIKTKTG